MGDSFFADPRTSRLGALLIQDARSGFCVLGGSFVERDSDLSPADHPGRMKLALPRSK